MQRSHSLTDSQSKNTWLKNGFRYFCEAIRIGLFTSGVLVDAFTDSLRRISVGVFG